MRKYILLLSALCILLSGCCSQLAESAGTEMSACMGKCSELCDLAKQSDMDLAGYNQIGLSKQSGSVEWHCSCPCLG